MSGPGESTWNEQWIEVVRRSSTLSASTNSSTHRKAALTFTPSAPRCALQRGAADQCGHGDRPNLICVRPVQAWVDFGYAGVSSVSSPGSPRAVHPDE